MATSETVTLDAPHAPHHIAIQAFHHVVHDIKHAILSSRRDWDKHEPRMWSRATNVDDHDLVNFHIETDLVLVRSGVVSYGQIIFGKLRIPAIRDELGEGFVHVRIHHSPGEDFTSAKFHSILTEERDWRAIQTKDEHLEFFNE